MINHPLVSIVIIAYNHEKFIRDAIEGCLNQKTDFPFEIIIHDDASMDQTGEIIMDYAKQYPEIIFPIIQKENQYSQGKKITLSLFPLARGKYIALCEGDDFWTDPKKLQKQVVFLEQNRTFSGSAHQALVLQDNVARIFRKSVKRKLTIEDLFEERLFHTASFVFLKENFLKYKSLPSNFISGDRLLFILVSAYGPIHYFDEPMCIYRKHDTGMSNQLNYDQILKDFAMVEYLQNNIKNFPKFKYLSFLHYTCIMYPNDNLSFKIILRHFIPFVFYSFSYFPKNIKRILFLIFMLIRKIFK